MESKFLKIQACSNEVANKDSQTLRVLLSIQVYDPVKMQMQLKTQTSIKTQIHVNMRAIQTRQKDS